MNIRTFSWLQGELSWAYVTARLCQAFEDLGHSVFPISTNGNKNSDSYFSDQKILDSVLALQHFGVGKKAIDLDFCYTVPANFSQRFLPNSRHKAAIYNYETWNPKGLGWPRDWLRYYGLADFYFPSSTFSAEVFCLNGIPSEKVFVIPHGVDTRTFNKDIPPIKLKTKKRYKFCSVVAPHTRKNIHTLLNAYCQAFTSKDDVCLVLKTKIYKHSDGMYDAQKNQKGRKPFEIVLGDLFQDLYRKYGKNIPEIEVLGGHVENVASIYNACAGGCHITTTGAEGFALPILESGACNLLNICPNYSGHLDFANKNNALLIDTKLREAKPTEQYWCYTKGSLIGQPSETHTAELMIKAYKEHNVLLEKFSPEMEKTVRQFSWISAAQKIIDVCGGKVEPYKKGTYNLKQHKMLK